MQAATSRNVPTAPPHTIVMANVQELPVPVWHPQHRGPMDQFFPPPVPRVPSKSSKRPRQVTAEPIPADAGGKAYVGGCSSLCCHCCDDFCDETRQQRYFSQVFTVAENVVCAKKLTRKLLQETCRLSCPTVRLVLNPTSLNKAKAAQTKWTSRIVSPPWGSIPFSERRCCGLRWPGRNVCRLPHPSETLSPSCR
jgi:hypothetical protein